jgi:hypothetical protein
MGNHDREQHYNWQELGFNRTFKHPFLLDGKFVFSHEPLDVIPDGLINIYGHVHGSKYFNTIDPNRLCACVERWNCAPIEYDFIKGLFNFDTPLRVCVAGIGLLGSSFIKNPVQEGGQFIIVAGFDTNINKIEVMKSDVPLFPAYEMADKIREMRIDLGIIAVPAQAAEMTMQRMKEGGIKGILNFSPAILGDKDIAVRNVHFAEELRFLTAMIPDLEKGV